MSDLRQSTPADPFARDVYTVSRLNLDARSLLEEAFSTVWIEGEISNLARPRSGHVYFSLKDEHCQVRCAMFRMYNRSLTFEPEKRAARARQREGRPLPPSVASSSSSCSTWR